MESSDKRKIPLRFRVFLGMLGILFVIGVGGIGWFLNLINTRTIEREANCVAYLSTPIQQGITNELCQRGLVPKAIADCSSTTAQLQNQDVEGIFRANVSVGGSTYQNITDIFSQYVTYCSSEDAKRNNPEFTCTYDISGVGPRISVYFNSSTEKVISINVPSCGGS